MTGPFREAPVQLACPRCGQTLNEASGDISACVQCGGIWLGTPAILTAFQDPMWPHGVGMWWRREIGCPVCAATGSEQQMTLVAVGDVLLDRCVDHGIWLDRGELARLIGGSSAKELDTLKSLLETSKAPTWVVEQQAQHDAARAARHEAEAAELRRQQEAAKAERDEAARKERQRELNAELTVERERLLTEETALRRRCNDARDEIAAAETRLREVRIRLATIKQQLAALE